MGTDRDTYQANNSHKNSVSKQLKKIAVDLTPILSGGGNGGAKIFVLLLLQELAKIAPNTQFILLTQDGFNDDLHLLQAPNIFRITPPQIENKQSRFLLDMEVDLLFCPITAPIYFEDGLHTVCTVYDLQYKTYPEFFSDEEINQRQHSFNSACSYASLLTAISDYSRTCAIKEGYLEESNIRTIYLCLAKRLNCNKEINSEILTSYALTKKRYLIYPANFWKHKNHEMLLTSFGMACQQGLPADIKLVCTGAPSSRKDWLIRSALAMGLADRVIFPGYLQHAEFSELMTHCAGLIYPSLYEGFGLPVIEAMSLGVPVACSNTTSLPEVAEQAAFLFDPRKPSQITQAMLALVNNEQLRASLIQAGLKRASEFSDTTKMALEYWQLFEDALLLPTRRLENLNYLDQLNNLTIEVNQLREQNTDALRQIHTLTAWVLEARAEAQQLRNENISAVDQINTLTAWVHEARDQVKKVSNKLRKFFS